MVSLNLALAEELVAWVTKRPGNRNDTNLCRNRTRFTAAVEFYNSAFKTVIALQWKCR